jgi:hypothetical protein
MTVLKSHTGGQKNQVEEISHKKTNDRFLIEKRPGHMEIRSMRP